MTVVEAITSNILSHIPTLIFQIGFGQMYSEEAILAFAVQVLRSCQQLNLFARVALQVVEV